MELKDKIRSVLKTSGPVVCEVLMADDQRLLQLMLTEELGLSLESFEHPIKQSFGAGIGVLIAACGTIASLYFGNFLMGIAFGAILLILAAALRAKLEKNRLLTSCVWNFSTSFLTLGILHFILKFRRPHRLQPSVRLHEWRTATPCPWRSA